MPCQTGRRYSFSNKFVFQRVGEVLDEQENSPAATRTSQTRYFVGNFHPSRKATYFPSKYPFVKTLDSATYQRPLGQV
jgi:hypothetical protein